MHVKMLTPWRDRDGITDYARALTEELGHLADVEIVPLESEFSDAVAHRMATQLNRGDVVHIQHDTDDLGNWRTPARVWWFWRLLKQIRVPSVVTVHDLPPLLSMRRGNGPIKTIIYNGLILPIVNWTPLGAFLRGGFLRPARHVIVHSSDNVPVLATLTVPERNISVLYPGIPSLVASDFSIRDKYRLEGTKILAMFGFIAPYKGIETALEALQLLPKNHVLLIAGGIRSDYYRSYLEQLTRAIQASGLQGRVVVTGYLDEPMVGAALAAADAVLVSRKASAITGGASYSLSYALAARRPVITSDLPFFCEIERGYSAVKTFPEGDAQALARTVLNVLAGDGGQPPEPEGAKRYREGWSWKSVAAKTYAIYERLLA